MAKCKKEDIHFETCYSASLCSGSVKKFQQIRGDLIRSGKDPEDINWHPIGLMYEANMNIGINTDVPYLFSINLRTELVKILSELTPDERPENFLRYATECAFRSCFADKKQRKMIKQMLKL